MRVDDTPGGTYGQQVPEVPLIFTVDEMLWHFADLWPEPSADEVQTALARLGRNSGPAFIFGLNELCLLTPEVASAVVPAAWSGAEWPGRALSAEDWRPLFDLAGYTADGIPAERCC